MTEREALKLALEFAEQHARHWTGFGRSGRDVVAAIKEALAQPERTWVGLTKEEVEDIEITWEATSEWSTFGHAARYIEAKLKEKNT